VAGAALLDLSGGEAAFAGDAERLEDLLARPRPRRLDRRRHPLRSV
jgi:hypothetical protein